MLFDFDDAWVMKYPAGDWVELCQSCLMRYALLPTRGWEIQEGYVGPV